MAWRLRSNISTKITLVHFWPKSNLVNMYLVFDTGQTDGHHVCLTNIPAADMWGITVIGCNSPILKSENVNNKTKLFYTCLTTTTCIRDLGWISLKNFRSKAVPKIVGMWCGELVWTLETKFCRYKVIFCKKILFGNFNFNKPFKHFQGHTL